MKFEEVIKNLATKSAVNRAANVKEGFRGEVSQDDLLKSKKVFLNEKRICKECCNFENNYDFRRLLLFLYLNEEDYSLKFDLKLLINKIKEFKEHLLKNEKYIYAGDREREIYNVVLETVMEDKKISADEFRILEKLRKKLGINILQHWMYRIQNGFFDELNKPDVVLPDNIITGYLRDLERRGLLFYIKKNGERYHIIPEEIAGQLMNIFDLELQFFKYEKLLNNPKITNKDKRNFLKLKGLDSYGISNELNKKIMYNFFKPSDFLNSLSGQSLKNILLKLNRKTSGTKQEKIRNIIEHYQEIYSPIKKIEDPREVYFEFYEDLANRNQSKLIRKGIITKGEEIGKAFESATTYLFEKILGFKLAPPKLKEKRHGVQADGKAVKNNSFIIWDCKTKDKYLTINTSERRQFIDYINGYKKADRGRFISFLIITSDIKDPMDIRKKLNEIKKETDVDISVIKAADLKKFADQVKKSGIEMDLTPFYHTKILDYDRHLKSFIVKK